MKNKPILAICLLLLSTVCSVAAEDYYVGPISGKKILNDFKKFAKHKDDIEYSDSQLAELRTIATPLTVKVFFGEWCHDSMREVPRLITLFEQVSNNNINVEYFGLDLKKSDPDGIAASYSIRKTPTIIVFRNGTELGRFLEFPKTDWANDIAALARESNLDKR